MSARRQSGQGGVRRARSSVRNSAHVSLIAHGASGLREAARRANGSTSSRMSDFLRLSSSWDRGSRSVRERILSDFVASCKSMTAPQLEVELAQGASLFLTRLTAWLRLSYLLNYNLALLLEAIGIFVTAASRGGGTRFIAEFLETGGIFTLLEIISIAHLSEDNKCVAMGLLIHICAAGGRKFKEFVCESGGMRALYSCLAVSRFEQTQSQARRLLLELAVGNPAHIQSLYKSLLSQLTSTHSLAAQITASRTLTVIFPSLSKNVHVSILEPILALLKSPQLLLQHEGYELLRVLLPRPELARHICHTLADFLDMIIDDGTNNHSGVSGAPGTLSAEVAAKEGKEDFKGLRGALDLESEMGGAQNHNRKPKSKKQVAVASSVASRSKENGNEYNDSLNVSQLQHDKESIFKHQQEVSRTHFYVLQTYAVRLLSQLAASSDKWIEQMVLIRLHMALLITICNEKCPESQRHAADLLRFLHESSSTVDEHLKTRLGPEIYALYVAQPLDFYKLLRREHILSIRRQATKMRRSVRLPPNPDDVTTPGRSSIYGNLRKGTGIEHNFEDSNSIKRQKMTSQLQTELEEDDLEDSSESNVAKSKSDEELNSGKSSKSSSKEFLASPESGKENKDSQAPETAGSAIASSNQLGPSSSAAGTPASSTSNLYSSQKALSTPAAKMLTVASTKLAKKNIEAKDAKSKSSGKLKAQKNDSTGNENASLKTQNSASTKLAPSPTSLVASANNVSVAPQSSIYVPFKTIVPNSKLNACAVKEKASILTIAREGEQSSDNENDFTTVIESSNAAREVADMIGQKFEATTSTVQQLNEIADRNFQKELNMRFPEIMDAAAATAAMISDRDNLEKDTNDFQSMLKGSNDALPEEDLAKLSFKGHIESDAESNDHGTEELIAEDIEVIEE